MTHGRATAEPYVTQFEATVAAVKEDGIRLDETYFYPGGGGQPADRGEIGETAVTGLRTDDEGIVHRLDGEPDVAVGDTVRARIDPGFRTYCMRAHTASHILYGAGRRVLNDLGYGGFDIGERKVRVDFATTTEIDDQVFVELERLTNRAIWQSRPVQWYEESISAVRGSDVAFNGKTEEGVFDGDTVRVVDIDGWDRAACGGTHVEDTREIGTVSLLDRSNPGEGLTRVEFAVGPTAVDERARGKEAVLRACRQLNVAVADLPDAVTRLQTDRDRLESEVAMMREQLLSARLESAAPVRRDGHDWIVDTAPVGDANDLADPVKSAAGEYADVVALAGQDGRTFVVVGAAGDVEAGDVVGEVTRQFGGGGGGSATFAQGGGIDADPEDIVEFLLRDAGEADDDGDGGGGTDPETEDAVDAEG
ncbi:hypothetical protein BRD17_02095 [Halobacteriales archaeon SW_7_68_16]|nr:MAG: hypothetical protein BRD17_02095 [Halobacteriales archaeon SW_7_68_16]